MRLGVYLDDGTTHWFTNMEEALQWFLDKGYTVSENIGHPRPIPTHIKLLHLIPPKKDQS
jgi:hypothetical protein